MIELVDVDKAYAIKGGKKRVLDQVSVVFPRGQSTGILGLNGAGKSTLLRLLGGSEMPDAGEIRRSVTVSWPLGFAPSFSGNLSGAENLRFVCRIYDMDVEEVVDFVRDFSSLGRYMDEPIKTYSSGMRARLAFGLSMAIDFQVYLVDESLSVGDQTFQRKCHQIFHERRERSDVIITSHHMSIIRDYCTRAGVLANGDLVMFEDIDAAEEYYNDVMKKLK